MAHARHPPHQSGAAPWVAFLAGAIVMLIAVVGLVLVADWGVRAPSRGLEVNVSAPPLPDIRLPNPPRLPTG